MPRFSDSAASKKKTKKKKSKGSEPEEEYTSSIETESFELEISDSAGAESASVEGDGDDGDDEDEEAYGEPWPGVSTALLDQLEEHDKMLEDSSVPGGVRLKAIIGRDDREAVPNIGVAPFDQICYLECVAANGKKTFVGTGWVFGPRVIITAGHCAYNSPWKDGVGRTYGSGPARSITAYFGRSGRHFDFSANAISIDIPKRWKNGQSPEWDFAAVFLDQDVTSKVDAFEIAVFKTVDLEHMIVNIAGYPADKSQRMFMHANRIENATAQRLEYKIDTYGGNSGGPVVCWHDDKNHVVGIHNYGDSRVQMNYATRINDDVFNKLMEWRNA